MTLERIATSNLEVKERVDVVVAVAITASKRKWPMGASVRMAVVESQRVAKLDVKTRREALDS